MEEQYKFEKLTLKDDVEIQVYEEALDFVFASSEIKNVAISGAYGAGKSSVLETYKKRHPQKKYLHISLAHFEEKGEEKAEGTADNKDDKISESVLEGKILNQLIHQVRAENIPQTNFKVKQNINTPRIWASTFGVMFMLMSIAFVLFFNNWQSFVLSFNNNLVGKVLGITANNYCRLLAGAVAIAILSYFIFKIIKLQKNRNILKRLNVQGNEIEIFETQEESFFDKYLNEVLYIFENSNVDVIVFEDMDRFEMNHIFERLREVNTLVNNQLKKSSKKERRVLRFFYLLRDDIFVSKDRTKFFDFIIPIVPVVDGTNSFDQFLEHLKRNNLSDKLDKRFLHGISLYIDDMRLLKNICNEFIIYYHRLNMIELNYNKMFAMIAYKNLFPRDFSELQNGRGYVFSLFQHKPFFINEEKKRIHALIESKKKEILDIKENLFDDEEELEFIRSILDKHSNFYGNTQTQCRNWYENKYKKHKQAIDDKRNSKISRLEQEIDSLTLQLSQLESKKLSSIINSENRKTIFKTTSKNDIEIESRFLDVKGNNYFDMLKYLISNGYIDESYSDYMTYFYENSLKKTDKIFLRSIADKNGKEPAYEIIDPRLVVSRMDVADFEERESLNFDIFRYLMEKEPTSEKMQRLIQQIQKTSNFEFVRQAFNYVENWGHYVAIINEKWPSFFFEAVQNGMLGEELLHKYSVYTFYYCDLDTIANINIEECLSKYVSSSPCYLKIDSPLICELIKGFKYIGIEFVSLNYKVSDHELLQAVYENDLYVINFENIKLMLSKLEAFESESEIIHKNYTLVSGRIKSPIYRYVSENINAYIEEIVASCEGYIDDSLNAVLEVLNNTAISKEVKSKYIGLLKSKILDISNINDLALQKECLDAGVVESTEQNVVSYYFSNAKMDKTLITFINGFSNVIDMRGIAFESSDKKGQFFSACILAIELHDLCYEQILVSLEMESYDSDNFNALNIPESKMNILIKNEILKMSSKTLKFIREKYNNVLMFFIVSNLDEYIGLMNANLYSRNEMLYILDMNVEDEKKIALIKYESNAISVLGKKLSKVVKLYILENRMERSDLEELWNEYENQDEKIQAFLFEKAVCNIHELISNIKHKSTLLCKALVSSSKVEQKNKISLLVALIEVFDIDSVKEFLAACECGSFNNIFVSGKQPRFKRNDDNRRILSALRDRGWIEDFCVDERYNTYYRIKRKKTKNSV